MMFGSVCSGIEAATVAWHELGWRAAWLAEIDKFASALLAHHYPSVPNLGDMTKIARAILTGEVPAPDVLCGGTPCQAFSVAGLRESLADARGNLTLKFVEIANAIDHVRAGRGDDECIVFWENVPGVFSTKDNAFGCFLAGLAGEDEPLQPPGQKWANAGAVYGPRRSVAWRTLDAQYFGVAQRRRRVFVVASARKGFDPAQVLFEWNGVRRDSAPSREARQTAPTIPSRSTAGGGLGTDFDRDGGLIQAYGGNNQSGPIDVATARNACASASGRMDFETETFLVQPANTLLGKSNCSHAADKETYVTHSLRGEGFDASEDGTGRGTQLVPVAFAIQAGALRINPLSGPDGIGVQADHAYTLEARAEVQAVCFDTTQVTSPANRSNPKPSDPCHPLAAGAHAPAIAFPANLSGTQCVSTEELAPAMGAANPTAVAVQASQSGVRFNETVGTLDANYGSRRHNGVMQGMQVRRLTPEECEALQGFPRSYTAIPWRGKPADQCPDGPRYKALGNSWAVPNVTWLGRRIQAALRNS
ncbi:MAG: DNA cytosine methyltransferase [Burkholderiales bacterium]|nr:DNA cytosine methyltransferase [Burkholderiales bacterium]